MESPTSEQFESGDLDEDERDEMEEKFEADCGVGEEIKDSVGLFLILGTLFFANLRNLPVL